VASGEWRVAQFGGECLGHARGRLHNRSPKGEGARQMIAPDGIRGKKSNTDQDGLRRVWFFRSISHANASMFVQISVNQCHQWFFIILSFSISDV